MSTQRKKTDNDSPIAGFRIVKRSKPDPREFLGPDAKTPDVKKLHKKYHSDSPEYETLKKAKSPTSKSATKSMIVQPKDRQDATSKRLTVLVKNGKVRAIQG